MGVAMLVVAALWSLSSYCYYQLVDGLGLDTGYNDAPVLFAAYYLAWTLLAVLWFRPVLARRLTAGMLWTDVVALSPLMLVFAAFAVGVLPMLPEIALSKAPENPPEFMFASAWYYLPKSVEILFQQVLVASLIRTASGLRVSLWMITLGAGMAFGAFHLLLALDGFTGLYVARFTLAASIFGLLAPYLYLRTRHGFRLAYALHWSFYALDATVTHFLLAGPPPV